MLQLQYRYLHPISNYWLEFLLLLQATLPSFAILIIDSFLLTQYSLLFVSILHGSIALRHDSKQLSLAQLHYLQPVIHEIDLLFHYVLLQYEFM